MGREAEPPETRARPFGFWPMLYGMRTLLVLLLVLVPACVDDPPAAPDATVDAPDAPDASDADEVHDVNSVDAGMGQ